MSKRIIKIPCKSKNFYRYFVELLNPILKLRKRELDVWAELLYYNDHYKDLPEEVRFKIVFDYEVKQKIATSLDISMDVLNNNLSELRKKKVIINNKLPEGYQVHPNKDKYDLVFHFQIDDSEKANS